MSREIKFRQPQFRYPDDATRVFTGFHYWGYIDGKFVAPDTHHVTPNEAERDSQQYTGLRDKNGKEIYEGDVWVCFSKQPGREGRELARFTVAIDLEKLTLAAWRSTQGEVIGNIYENPELVK